METPPPKVPYFEYDPLTAAFHEVGHATVQAVTEIGPDKIIIKEAPGGGWVGNSKVFETALSQPELLDLQCISGPLAQTLFAEASLKQHADLFRDGILRQHEQLLAPSPPGRIAIELQWLGDLHRDTDILFRLRCLGAGSRDAYLLAQEEALRLFFKQPIVDAFVRSQAQKLADERTLDAPTFIAAALGKTPPAAIELLKAASVPAVPRSMVFSRPTTRGQQAP